MKEKHPNGTTEYAADEWSLEALQDAKRGRASRTAQVPAAFKGIYDEAYINGIYFRNIIGEGRITI